MDQEIFTQPLNDPVGTVVDVGGACYVKMPGGGSITKVLYNDSGQVAKDINRVTQCVSSQPIDVSQVSTDNVLDTTVTTTDPGFPDTRCLDINTCDWTLKSFFNSEVTEPGELIRLADVIQGVTRISITYESNISMRKNLDILVDGQWINVFKTAAELVTGPVTHWIEFPSQIESQSNINSFPVQLGLLTSINLKGLRIYATDPGSQDQMTFKVTDLTITRGVNTHPLLSKPIKFEYIES
jgi:hypothetical protein